MSEECAWSMPFSLLLSGYSGVVLVGSRSDCREPGRTKPEKNPRNQRFPEVLRWPRRGPDPGPGFRTLLLQSTAPKQAPDRRTPAPLRGRLLQGEHRVDGSLQGIHLQAYRQFLAG